jgi:hypothetical protein
MTDSIVFLFCLIDRCSCGMKMRLGRCRSTGWSTSWRISIGTLLPSTQSTARGLQIKTSNRGSIVCLRMICNAWMVTCLAGLRWSNTWFT